MNTKQILLLILFLSGFGVLGAQETDLAKFGIDTERNPAPAGLKPGDKAPFFAGYDQTGVRIESRKVLESGPVVLVFYLGKWSSYCSRYLNNYQDSLDILKNMDINLIAVTPESIENVEQTVKFHNLTFTVIYDCQEQIMKDYKVMFEVTKAFQDSVRSHLSADIAVSNGRETAHLPVPATFIISREGIISAVHFDPDYRNRASVGWMIRNLGPVL